MLKAFCRVAPSVLFNILAMVPAFAFFFAFDFRVLISAVVHARRNFLAIMFPLMFGKMTLLAGLPGKQKPKRGDFLLLWKSVSRVSRNGHGARVLSSYFGLTFVP
jgi:hypothetical protein